MDLDGDDEGIAAADTGEEKEVVQEMRRRGLRSMSGYQSKPPWFLVLNQAPELGDGHPDRTILTLYHKGFVLADRYSFKPDSVIRSRNN